jgi:hypothetical protein
MFGSILIWYKKIGGKAAFEMLEKFTPGMMF